MLASPVCNDKDMFLPGEKSPVQVKKVLHHAVAVRGRCVRVVLVYKTGESDKRDESKSDFTIPAPGSNCRSPRLQSHEEPGAVGKSPSSFLVLEMHAYHNISRFEHEIQVQDANRCVSYYPFVLMFI